MMPKIRMVVTSSVVATGRLMNGSATFMTVSSAAATSTIASPRLAVPAAVAAFAGAALTAARRPPARRPDRGCPVVTRDPGSSRR